VAIAEPLSAPEVIEPPGPLRSAPVAASRHWLFAGARPVALCAAVVALVATMWSARTRSMLLYGDAQAHLDVARRVTDGLRTGPTQLGSVWLPLPHVLMVPLVFFRPLWRSGAAGAIVGGGAFVYATTRLFTLVEELTGSRVGAWCAAAVMAGNLNMLYLQSTPLTEPVLVAFIAGSAFHLARWTRTLSPRDLLWAALLTAAATLTRYEGWSLLIGALAAVVLWSCLADRRRKSPEANIVLFAVVGGYGVVLWLLYNQIIFHDPLYFLHSNYSAHAIDGPQAKFGRLVTHGRLLESVLTYGWAALGLVGPVMLISAGVAIVVIVARRSPQGRTLLILGVLLVPVIFGVVSLYLGQSTIWVPQRPPHAMYNDRYTVVALPFVAAAVGCAVGRWRLLAPAAVAATAAAVVLMGLGTPLVLADGRAGTSSADAGQPEIAAAYLHAHYRGGEVLADEALATPFIFASNLNLKSFVAAGDHPYWENALRSPATSVAWAVTKLNDAVARDMAAYPKRFADFRPVVRDRGLTLYQRVGPPANGA
jgi:hypothetical protein